MSEKGNWTDGIMRKVGVSVVCGALVLASLPCAAIAEGTGQPGGAPTSSSQPAEPPSGGMGTAPGEGGAGGPGGANTMTFDYTGSYSGAITADGESVSASDATYEATEADQNAALAQNGGALALTGVTLAKSGDDTDGDRCNFYGVNSILLAVGENSAVNVSDSTLTATSEGSNAIFATDGGTVTASGVSIRTTADNSRGLDATYGGTINATDMDITTEGDHCATVATDRGGGTITVADSALSTAGSGSPLLYSTGDIEVTGITGTATGSQIAGMEGLNTILIGSSTLESTLTGATASDPIADGIIIYQSTSGDAESTTGETATFQAADSTLKSAIQSGSMFYLTNTSADVVLKNTVLDFDSSAADLLLAAGNDSNNWGSAGSNGATVRLTGIGQTLEGNVAADTISSVDLHLTQASTWTGMASIEQNSASSTSDAPITVNVDGTSTWVVTGDCTISALNVADGARIVDASGKTVSVVADGQTVVSGDSDVTVTVTGSYSTDYDGSTAGTLDQSLESTESADAGASASDAETASTNSDSAATSEAQSPWEAFLAWIRGVFGF